MGQSADKADQAGVFNIIHRQTGGKVLLAIIAAGLVCYSIWRAMQAFMNTEQKGNKPKGWATRARYFFSGLVYASIAGFAIKMVFSGSGNSNDNKQGAANGLLNQPFGQWLTGIAAVIIAAVGIYQVYYGLSKKFRKHANGNGTNSSKAILIAGTAGYVSRGIVWIIISWLFVKAALHSNASEAGDTSKAFGFLSEGTYGPYLLAVIGAGLVCYGVFNFIRMKYDQSL